MNIISFGCLSENFPFFFMFLFVFLFCAVGLFPVPVGVLCVDILFVACHVLVLFLLLVFLFPLLFVFAACLFLSGLYFIVLSLLLYLLFLSFGIFYHNPFLKAFFLVSTFLVNLFPPLPILYYYSIFFAKKEEFKEIFIIMHTYISFYYCLLK